MRRFWKEAAAVADAGGWGIKLDGKPLRTPARAALVVPTEELAEAIAGEWRGAKQHTIDHAEDRGIGTDAQGERKHRRSSEGSRAP